MIDIVDAEPGHGEAIAHVHAASWIATYRGILEDDYLDNHALDDRMLYWRQALATGQYHPVKVAVVEKQVTGFIALHVDQDDVGYDFTIEHLHVLPDYKGRGLGKALIRASVMEILAQDASKLCLWVFEDNKPAIRFYENLGGLTDAYSTDVMANKPDRRIGWHDLQTLVEACGRNP